MIVFLLNLAYVLTLAGFLIREVFWMRLALAVSQVCFILYAILAKNLSITLWNTGFILVNGYQVVRILRQRSPIDLPPDLEEIYRKSFRILTRREFLYFWRTGRQEERDGGEILLEDARRQALYLILTGTVTISRKGEEVARLGGGDFLADSCEYLFPGPSPIGARGRGIVSLRRWDHAVLEDLGKLDPHLLVKIHKIAAGYLTAKLRAALDEV